MNTQIFRRFHSARRHCSCLPLFRTAIGAGVALTLMGSALLLSPAHANEFTQPFGPPGWALGVKRTLVIRVDFPDSPDPVIDDATLLTAMNKVDQYYRAASQGRCSFATTLVPGVLRLARTKVSYQTEGSLHHDLASDVAAAAVAYDVAHGGAGTYNPEKYDRWILMCDRLDHGRLGESLTRGESGAKTVWFDSPRWDPGLEGTLIHELGHTQGLFHAAAWLPTGSSPTGDGTHIEYGDLFDVMGGLLLPARHFNTAVKRAIGFLDPDAVQLVAESGTYRIYRHDHADAAGIRAVRLRTSQSEFWLEHRRETTGLSATAAKRTQEGILIHWTKWPDAAGRLAASTYLLDATPGSAEDLYDAALTLGESFTNQGITVTPLSVGGVSPREYIDVRIDVPAIITQQPVSRQVEVGGSATFEVVASGSGLTYQWQRYGAAIPGATSSKLTVANAHANDAAAYAVIVTSAAGSVVSQDARLQVGSYYGPILVDQFAGFSGTGSISLLTIARGDPGAAYQWWQNGVPEVGAYGLGDEFPQDLAHAGLHYATAGNFYGTITSRPAIVGMNHVAKISGAGREVGSDIRHANGNIYDQILLEGSAVSVRADAGQVVRVSYVDLSNDIVQVEFGGAGTLTLTLDNPTGPAPAVNYNQPAVSYMKGHGSIVVTGANETTNLTVFSVGRDTAVDQTLFRNGVVYDGLADLGFVAIQSPSNRFGGLRTANASYWHTRGYSGVYAPGVQFDGPVWVGDVNATDAATPVLIIGGSNDVRITGGDLEQGNGRKVQVAGISQLRFTDGTDSHGRALPLRTNHARLEQDEVDVTARLAP